MKRTRSETPAPSPGAAAVPDQLAEAARLAALRRLGVLDTAPEERFDIFTRLAASVCGTPIATVSLVDEQRVWFKSALGLPEGVHEVPRDIAACAKVIANPDQVMVVPDARLDPRLNTSPLVTGDFGMRFYAGVPLLAPGGEAVGSLCVIDTVPREPGPELEQMLRNLANGVGSVLRLHELRETAFKDPVTGLGNRRMFDESLAAAIAEARRGDHAVGLVLLDVDRFKSVNDQFGHQAGDGLLRAVGGCIGAVLREGDVAARTGGDEFCILLPDLAPARAEAALAGLADRIVGELRGGPVSVQGQRIAATVSAGYALVRPARIPGQDASSWLARAADLALYRAKKSGRGRVAAYTPELAGGIASKQALARDLRGCLARGGEGLALVLQPIRAAADRRILAFEALLRWTHPEFGPIPPGDFVPVAERTGLAPALDRWVLDEAARVRAGWGAGAPAIAVNVSPTLVMSEELLPAVREVLARHGLPPDALGVEMTERLFLDDIEAAARTAAALVEMGVTVGLDDFGAGHASFAYLKDVPFTKVKIDLSLVAGIDADTLAGRRGRAIVEHVVRMVHAIGGRVVAEGVEGEAQFAVLRAAGCDAMQGWLLGRPAPAEAWRAELPRAA